MKRSPGLGRPTRPPSRTWPFKQFEQFKRFKPLERFHPVAKQAFVSITVARQRGNRTPFRFFIPGFFRFYLLLFSRFKQFERIERFKPQFQPPFVIYRVTVYFFTSRNQNPSLLVTEESAISIFP